MIGPFDAPIPGESLTKEPKNAIYENPPKINDPAEAIELHLDNLSNPTAMEGVLELLESDRMTIADIVQGLTRVAVAHGYHSIDMSLIIGPVIHEFIKQTADVVGVSYKEGFEHLSPSEKDRMKVAGVKAKRTLSKEDAPKTSVTMDDIDPVAETEVEEVQEKTTKGLMSRETE